MRVQGFPDLATSGNAVSPGRLEGTISGPIPGLLSQNLHFNMAPDHNVGGNWETSGRICISNKFLEDSARFWTLACTLGSTLEFWETLPWRLCGSAPLTLRRKKQSLRLAYSSHTNLTQCSFLWIKGLGHKLSEQRNSLNAQWLIWNGLSIRHCASVRMSRWGPKWLC